jgi:hypothetical protein
MSRGGIKDLSYKESIHFPYFNTKDKDKKYSVCNSKGKPHI